MHRGLTGARTAAQMERQTAQANTPARPPSAHPLTLPCALKRLLSGGCRAFMLLWLVSTAAVEGRN
eukprot:6186898-Pleurochrysis_carterae.AAC.3